MRPGKVIRNKVLNLLDQNDPMRRPAIILFFLAIACAASAAPADRVVSVTVEQCRQVVAHQPADDVAYRPGVDFRGRPVAPADLAGPGAIETPEWIEIALIPPLREFLGAATPPFIDRAEVQVGTVAYDIRTGRLSYNGQPLSDPAAHALAAECARQLKARNQP